MVNAQDWLKDNYESKKNDTTEIRINIGTKLEGKLIINGYPKIKTIFLAGAEGITDLEIENCPDVEMVYASKNQITEIKGLETLIKLKKLSVRSNKIKKIDLSNSVDLEMINFSENPTDLEIKGIENLSKLVNWDSYKTFDLTKILDQKNEKELKEIAKELELNVEGKNLEGIKQAIKDEAEKIKENKGKLNTDLPGLLDNDSKVDDTKLKEIKDNVEKGTKYQTLVDESNNVSILNEDKKEIDQNKLTSALEELKQLHDIDNHKSNEKILDNGKFSQSKLDAELKKGDDYTEFVKNNPKLVTGDKIDQEKINDMNNKAEKFTELESTLGKLGIDPKNTEEAKKKLEGLNALKLSVEDYFGEEFEQRLGVQEFQKYIAQVEVNTNNKN